MAAGLLARLTGEPRSPGASRASRFGRTVAGVRVTPDDAVKLAAVWACLRYLSQTVAVLPWHVMRDGERGPEVQRLHPVDWLLSKRPAREWSSFQFRETLTHWAARWGNGYAEIEPDALGRPFALWPIHPERVTPCRAEEPMQDSYGADIDAGALYYEVSNGTGPKTILELMRMFHVRGFGEGPVGVNVIDYAAESIGWARAAQLFGAAFFGNGARPGLIIKNKKALSPEALEVQREQFDEMHGGPRNAFRTAHLDLDADIEEIGFDAEKAQLIEAHQFLVEEICRWFGVPPHKVMHLLRATFSNIEHQAIEVVVDSVTPWAKRFEDEADFKLFGQNRMGLYTKMNLRGLLRGDFKSQNEGLQIARQNGVISADEWRAYLDMNRTPAGGGGEKRVMQQQYTTLERIGEVSSPSAQSNDAVAAAHLARIGAMMKETSHDEA
ncbi:HK97 family phage portal protein [Kaistia hirudinis]|uniref:HK97 family phage portal protein n=1 Tax=Kaistia hirudinis TaxID=1293440 RepID=A0A840ANS5_9HYPH|nr:phage portal protein [Kaistia hirudinis]MBB3930066.1 HK97 family phage portal protein [Kaistia hirudinis]